MTRVRKTGWVLLVWLTGLSTALGNFPHFACSCAKAPTSKAGSRSASENSSCCCCQGAKDCCRHPVKTQDVKKPCCQQQEPTARTKSPAQASQQGPELTTSPCHKTLAPADVSSQVSQKKTAQEVLVQFLHVLEATNDDLLPLAPFTFHPFETPPPPDLVTVLQRLLI